ncbi:MAG: NDP-sugar synthase [Myxococcota bacterium]|nr:NDP-sugar synthase [Myxococcota bacterium]
MRAMILAAGLGSRLRPITDTCPKPLVPIAGVANIERTIHHLKRSGIREIVINTHHLKDVLMNALGDGSALGVEIAYSIEDVLLGTGGGIKKALTHLLGQDPFFVLNGDALFVPDLASALDTHRRRGALATLIVREDPQAEAYGAVGVDEAGQVQSLVGQGSAQRTCHTYMFTGVHVIDPRIEDWLPSAGCIVRQTYIPLLQAGVPIWSVCSDAAFFDLGTPQRYLAANIALVTGAVQIPGYSPGPKGVFVSDTAVLEPHCHLGPGTVICDGARIGSGAHIERAVVLPGAVVQGRLKDAIVTEKNQVLQVVG